MLERHKNVSNENLALILKCHNSTVRKKRKEYGFKYSSNACLKWLEIDPLLTTKTVSFISEKYKIARSTVTKRIVKLGVIGFKIRKEKPKNRLAHDIERKTKKIEILKYRLNQAEMELRLMQNRQSEIK
jgi:hypothetical protein